MVRNSQHAVYPITNLYRQAALRVKVDVASGGRSAETAW